jgi:hypothetical protein
MYQGTSGVQKGKGMKMQEARVGNSARTIMVWKAVSAMLLLVVVVLASSILIDNSINPDVGREAVLDKNVAGVPALQDADLGIAVTAFEELETLETETILNADLGEKLNSLRPWRGGLVLTK